jgi:hypothetical protein
LVKPNVKQGHGTTETKEGTAAAEKKTFRTLPTRMTEKILRNLKVNNTVMEIIIYRLRWDDYVDGMHEDRWEE